MIALLGGGLDSLAIWRLSGLPRAIHFDVGQTAAEAEFRAIASCAYKWNAPVEFAPLPAFDELPNGYVPHRNAMLVLAAAQRDPEVLIGQVAEWGPDKNRRFFRRLQRLADQGTTGAFVGLRRRHRFLTPYRRITKGQLLVMYRDAFGGPALRDLLADAVSCYMPPACGLCAGCAQRAQAERAAFGRQLTPTARHADIRLKRAAWPDVLRWIRDEGSIVPVARRADEARRARLSA